MKRRILYLSVFALVAFPALLALSGCESKAFKAEREMWRAHKSAQAVYKNPKGTPPFQLAAAQEQYRKIIKKYSDSLFAIQSQFSIGHLYLVIGDFQKARVEYRKLTLDCDKKGNLCAEAFFAIGNSYELEGKWDDALSQYKMIMQSFSFSAKSLDLPLYIIRHYRKAGNEVAIKSAVDEAVSYYTGLKSKSETEKGGYILQSLVTRSYLAGQQYEDALASLDKVIRDYPKYNPEQTLWIKMLIYANRLKDNVKAKEILQKIMSDYPQSKLAKSAEVLLKKF